MPDHAQPTDGQLLARATAGDEEAFALLYRRRGAAVYRFALGMTGSREAAEEVLQETFLALIEKPSGFNPSRGELVSYLYGIARNHSLRAFRKLGDLAALDDDPRDVAASAGLLEALETKDRIEALRRAVLALPEVYREAVILCDIEELGYAQAAEALGTVVGTVRSRLHRGRALLAQKLGVAPARNGEPAEEAR